MKILSENSNFIFQAYMNEFERMWIRAIEYRECDPVNKQPGSKWIYSLYNSAVKFQKAIKYSRNSEIPLPRMAIIYPTYKCNLHCSYCSYRMFQSAGREYEMNIDLFNYIINDLITNGILNIEISGGGEPFLHSKIDEILNTIKTHKNKENAKFGILTNGLEIEDTLIDDIVNNFTYIRLSYADKIIESEKFKEKFKEKLGKILSVKREYDSKILVGLKILLTKGLIKKFKCISVLDEIIRQYDINHLRIKIVSDLEKEPSNDEIEKIRPELYECLQDCNIDVYIDIDRYKINQQFVCWFGACAAVIDPNGAVYPCLNYHIQPTIQRLKNVGEYTFSNSIRSFWDSQKLRLFFERISPNACRAATSVSCRFAKYQQKMEEFISQNEYIKNIQENRSYSILDGFF